MKKSKLENFIHKYNLGGLVESVNIVVHDSGITHVEFFTDDMNVYGKVQSDDVGLPPGEYPIFDTQQLLKLLSILTDEPSVTRDPKGKNITFSDSRISSTFVLADPRNIPPVGGLKFVPDFDVNILVDSDLVNSFIRATSALSAADKVAVRSMKGEIEILLGYDESVNTNRISIRPEATVLTSDPIPNISFPAKHLKNILFANKGAPSGQIRVSGAGLMLVQYQWDNTTSASEYYISKIQVS